MTGTSTESNSVEMGTAHTKFNKPTHDQPERAIPAPHPDDIDGLLVSFDDSHDSSNPFNWARLKKWRITVLCGLLTFGTTWASSMYVSALPCNPRVDTYTVSFSTGAKAIHDHFGTSLEVAELGLTLFMMGCV
jgi:hypothetical protein